MIFTDKNSGPVLDYIKSTYGGEPEFLWAKSPLNAALRHKGTKKWYAAILRLPRNKLGLTGSELIDIIDLKCDPLLVTSLIGQPGYLPAYHMNKEHWITILLDGTVPTEDICPLIDLSYKITSK